MKACTPIKRSEFKRIVEHGHQLNVIAQQHPSMSFSIMAIANPHGDSKVYVVHHTRTFEPREWRLDRLASVLKKSQVKRFEVRFYAAPEVTLSRTFEG